MKRLALATLSLLFAFGPAFADTLDGGLPAAGSVLVLRSTNRGYEARVIVSAQQHYRDISGSSSNAVVNGAREIDKAYSSLPSGKKWLREIDIKINTPRLAQGQYDLTLTVTPETGDPFEREIWVQVPAAQIDAPPTLVIKHQQWWPWWSGATRPQIWESSRHAWLTGVTLIQKGDTDAGGEPAGNIAVTASPFDVPPGGSRRLEFCRDFRLDGIFPLGTAKGTLVVQADQLAAPVPFAFEIRSSIPTFYLVATLGAGLLSGWLARKGLKNILTASQKRQEAFALIAQIDRSVQVNTDPKFQTDAAVAREVAVEATRQTDAAVIESSTKTAKDGFTVASDDLALRRKQLRAKVDSLKTIAGWNWQLPSKLTRCVSDIGGKIPLVNLATDIGGANDTVDKLIDDLRQGLTDACATLRLQIDDLQAVGQPLSAFHESAVTQFAQSLTDAAKAISAAELTDPGVTVDQLKTSLSALQANMRKVREAIDALANAVGGQINQWSQRLTAKALPSPQAWDAAMSDVLAFCASLRKAADDLGDFSDLASQAGKLPDEMQQALKLQIPADAPQAVLDIWNRGAQQDTVNWLALHLPARMRTSAHERYGIVETRLPDVITGTQIPLQDAKERPPLESPADLRFIEPLAGETPEAAEVRERDRAWWIGGGIYAIYAAVITGAGYLLFEAKWVGLPIDFATAFFWAFAIDVGADAATSVLQGFPKK